MTSSLTGVKALVFDVFGTVFDWHTNLTKILAAHARPESTLTDAQWALFAHKWRQGIFIYRRAAVERGKYFSPETIYLRTLEELVRTEDVNEGWDEATMKVISEAWKAQTPWEDTPMGMESLKAKFIVVALSNGSAKDLITMNRASGVTWDYILTSDIINAIKPSPEAYKAAIRLLGLKPEEIAMVAAHEYDLEAAKSHSGMKTVYIDRDTEDTTIDKSTLKGRFDLLIESGGLRQLAKQLESQSE
ncbi:Hydrolase domain-containing protein [Rhizoctonia solani AG-1 IA]|uniref:Haloacid dehalogenase n=2 Tax=Rhizoctonia solani TaxID=456999 RepID=A0A8H7H5J8_9AGAM|nr:Hydrolase domain-containing protein [Rhizoctonia solani AG-1 IA]KAF8675278.1 Haloacid dehalogenase [Rhizoctonia solani]